MDGLIYLGHMAVFYLPVQKLDSIECGENGQTPREMLHQFLMEHYDAYTMEISDTQGFWRMNQRSQIFVDKNARYEVSFEGRQRIREFVAFLSHLCELMEEQAIYLTMGHKSWLVVPIKE